MDISVINKLIGTRDQTCVSIVIPTDTVDKRKNLEMLKKATRRTKALLNTREVPDGLKTDLVIKIDSLAALIPKKVSVGLGIFLSQEHLAFILFPFAVKYKIKLGNDFEIRDLLYLKQYSAPYYIVNPSKKGVHLFKGELSELEEIIDGRFPLGYHDDFEYARASIADASASSLKGFEKGKNEITEIRLKAVFREADALLPSYLARDGALLMAGTQKMISLFHAVTAHNKQVICKIYGSFSEENIGKLREAAWEAFVRYRKNDIASIVQNLDEKNNGQVVEGLHDAWIAANEGKGLALVVEKDYHRRAYRTKAKSALHIQTPGKPYTVVSDAVDELIQAVEARKGTVLLTENDQLKNYAHVALVLRY